MLTSLGKKGKLNQFECKCLHFKVWKKSVCNLNVNSIKIMQVQKRTSWHNWSWYRYRIVVSPGSTSSSSLIHLIRRPEAAEYLRLSSPDPALEPRPRSLASSEACVPPFWAQYQQWTSLSRRQAAVSAALNPTHSQRLTFYCSVSRSRVNKRLARALQVIALYGELKWLASALW